MSGAATGLKIAKSKVITLAEAGISESALEKLIADDPASLQLGDVVLIERQRIQEKAGRLDLLLEDSEGETRYEVELMLGSLDESHLIRAIEYWDIERRHYPGYDHRAVIVAEDITSRFLNVIQLFSGSIPIIAIQVNCLRLTDGVAVSFIKVIDSTRLRRDDHADLKAKATDRNYWLSYSGAPVVNLADECLNIINGVAKNKRTLNYNKGFIGLLDGNQANNFVYFRPRKSFLRIRASVSGADNWAKRLEDAGLDAAVKDDGLAINVTPQNFADNKALIQQMLEQAVKEDER